MLTGSLTLRMVKRLSVELQVEHCYCIHGVTLKIAGNHVFIMQH
jgi:hypothetical protein